MSIPYISVPSSNNLPGTNYNVKPYVDDGSSLPSVNGRVQSVVDGLYIEGSVISVSNGPPRTITLSSAFQVTNVLASSVAGQPPTLQFTVLSSGPTYPWAWFTYSTNNSSAYWFGRNNT
jgi:hypothetical protein